MCRTCTVWWVKDTVKDACLLNDPVELENRAGLHPACKCKGGHLWVSVRKSTQGGVGAQRWRHVWKANIWLRPSHLGRVNRPAFSRTTPNSTGPTHSWWNIYFADLVSGGHPVCHWAVCELQSDLCVCLQCDRIISACVCPPRPPSAGTHSSVSPAGGSGLSDTLFRPKISHPLIAPLLSTGTCFFCVRLSPAVHFYKWPAWARK